MRGVYALLVALFVALIDFNLATVKRTTVII